jgi:inner membrane transporter RhtA
MPDRHSNALPVGMVLAGIVSVQLGSAVAFETFDELGPGGTVLLRAAFAALVLGIFWRPRWRGHDRDAWRRIALFGFVLGAMNLCFYLGLDRVPLGIAVTLEFIGPLGVALAGSRRALDLVWVALAAGGILLLSPGFGGSIDTLGACFCLAAGGFWGAYILLTVKVGREFPGGSGLALAMLVSAVMLTPVGIADGGADLLALAPLAAGFAIAVLSSAIPYSLELEALRTLPTGVFGVLMSLEPAVAALVGLFALDQDLASKEAVAIGLVVIASAGALRAAARKSGRPPVIEH